MNFDLSEELQLVRDAAREYADREVAPTADARDREHRFPRAEFDKAAELGLTGVLVPEDLGGMGLGTLALTVVIEEVSRACASTGVTLSVHNSLVCSPIRRHGTDEQQRRYLPRLAGGEPPVRGVAGAATHGGTAKGGVAGGGDGIVGGAGGTVPGADQGG